jgi:putative transcription factor
MAKCEVCGANIPGDPLRIDIDGAIMLVCVKCSRLGRPAKQPFSPLPARTVSFQIPGHLRKSAGIMPEEELSVREDYPSILRAAREAMGLTQEQLGMKVNEKSSVIAKLESGKLKPSIPLAKKLEHVMKVHLVEQQDPL